MDAQATVERFLKDHLPDSWELYSRPPLNGLKPDLVALDPRFGMAVYLVRESIESPAEIVELSARIEGAKREIFELYCPSLNRRSGLGKITAGLLLPAMTEDVLNGFLESLPKQHVFKKHPKLYPVAGKETFQEGRLASVFPLHARRGHQMTAKLAADLRSWLVEPDFVKALRRPLDLDARQGTVATTRTEGGYRRIRGPAGSGKSQVLAARAARLAAEGKRVLVVSYNITLLAYLRELAGRHWNELKDERPASARFNAQIDWFNFHRWCKRSARVLGREDSWNQLWREARSDFDRSSLLNDGIAETVESWLRESRSTGGSELQPYDAILVDEGQDFRLSWWSCLRRALAPGGEMLLAADATQDVYETARAWTDEAMEGAGFRGPWLSLEKSYRMPGKLMDLAEEFARRFLPRDGLTTGPGAPAQRSLEFSCNLRWVQTTPQELQEKTLEATLQMPGLAKTEPLAWPDVCLLVQSNELGRGLVRRLDNQNIKAAHTFFEDDGKSRSAKLALHQTDARVKGTTIHSFKGWESRSIVLAIERAKSRPDLAAIYVALTRLKRHPEGSWLTVVCGDPRLRHFGRRWSSYEEPSRGNVA